MPQNIYDDPEFFAAYSRLPRSTGGLDAAGEWPALRALLPDLAGRQVLDLGCGFGWHCRYACDQGARSVVGVDLSERMLARAATFAPDPRIEYRRAAIEAVDFPPEQFDVVLSSLALHYVERFDRVCANVSRWLAPGGAFVFSVEHPIFTALAAQDWCYGPGGEQRHWPVDNYQEEGLRHARWLADDVIKYHRTLATYVNTLLSAGFCITGLAEPQPSPELLQQQPGLAGECRRPIFLLLAGRKLGTEEG